MPQETTALRLQQKDKPELKPITSAYFYESDFFSTLNGLGKIVLAKPGSDLPVLPRKDFLQPGEAAFLTDWLEQSAAENADDSAFSESMPNGRIVLHTPDVLALCNALAQRASADLQGTFGVKIGRVAEARGTTIPEGASATLHTDHAVRQYDDDGWPVAWPSTAKRSMLTLLFFLSDSVDEISGDNQCLGGNIEFPYIFDQDFETLLLEPRRGQLLAFPDHPVYSYRINQIYENQSRFVAAWAEVEE